VLAALLRNKQSRHIAGRSVITGMKSAERSRGENRMSDAVVRVGAQDARGVLDPCAPAQRAMRSVAIEVGGVPRSLGSLPQAWSYEAEAAGLALKCRDREQVGAALAST